jgi:hypothetical protein
MLLKKALAWSNRDGVGPHRAQLSRVPCAIRLEYMEMRLEGGPGDDIAGVVR